MITEFRGAAEYQPFEWVGVPENSHVFHLPELDIYVWCDEVEQLGGVALDKDQAIFCMSMYGKSCLNGINLSAMERFHLKRFGNEYIRWREDNDHRIVNKWRHCDPYGVPLEEEILLMWEDGHIESGIFFETPGEEYPVNYRLWDGDRITKFPSKWMHIPDSGGRV